MKKIIFILLFSFIQLSLSAQIPRMSDNLLGKGDLSWLFFDVYEARLWATDATSLYEKPFSLELTYKMEFDGEDIVEQTLKELKHLGEEEESLKKWKPDLMAIFPNIKKGDTITANYHPEKGLSFYLNLEKKLGAIKDQALSVKFLNIWLSEKSRAPKLRKKLLGDA
jgi:hypothetical protein